MPQVMSAETEALAAEYVLGTLDSEERAQAQNLLATDESFVAKVKVWERRLGELHLMVEPVEPDGRIWQRIKAKMPEVVPVVEIAPPEPEPEPKLEPEPAPEPSSPSAPEPSSPPAPEPSVSFPPPLPPAPTMPAPSVPVVEAATSASAPAPASAAANFDAVLAAITEPLPPPPPPTPPSAETAPRTSVAPGHSPTVVTPPPSAPAPVVTPDVTRAPAVEVEAEKGAVIRGRLTRWRVLAVLMTLVVLSTAALVAAWRFVPDRLPPMLQPLALMRLIGVNVGGPASPPPRPPAPPESQYDE